MATDDETNDENDTELTRLWFGQMLAGKQLSGEIEILIPHDAQPEQLGSWLLSDVITRTLPGTTFRLTRAPSTAMVTMLQEQLEASHDPHLQMKAARMVLDLVGPVAVAEILAERLARPKDKN